jgi:hypothetical protein
LILKALPDTLDHMAHKCVNLILICHFCCLIVSIIFLR